jgi:putative restriction endonuclease
MKLFLAPTDLGWYRFLAGQQPEEVNFWQPNANTGFHALDNGDPLESGHLFLFKLKGSINKIAGGGIFIGYSKLQLSVAWNIFGEHNGAASLQEFSDSIRAYMSAGNAHAPDLSRARAEWCCRLEDVVAKSHLHFERKAKIVST